MASNTPNLGLYKKDPVVDGNDTFNVQTMMNDNWDKVDGLAGTGRTTETVKQNADDLIAHLADGVPDGVHGIATTADLTLYVDAALGDDTNTGLAAGAGFALKTMQAAINKIPQIVNHGITVNVAAGTYAETVTVKGFIGNGFIIIVGGADRTAALNYLVDSFNLTRNMVYVRASGFKVIKADALPVSVLQCMNFAFNNCVFDGAAGYARAIEINFASGNLNYCSFSNFSSTAVVAYNSIVSLNDCIGSGNTYSIGAYYGAVVAQTGVNYPGLRIRSINGPYTRYGGIVTPIETAMNITLYVRPDGSDDNDGSADDAAHALRTIQEAINRVPKTISTSHIVTINVAPGTYDEALLVLGFTGGGALRIYAGVTISDNYSIRSVICRRCSCKVEFRGFLSTDGTNIGFTATENIFVGFTYCKRVVASINQGFNLQSGFYEVGNCEISNQNDGIYTTMHGKIYSYTNTGTGNVYGIRAYAGGVIAKNGTQPGGTTAEYVSAGGEIR